MRFVFVRASSLVASACLFSVCGALSAPAQLLPATQSITSIPLSKFQSSLGINTHMEYTDGKYADANQVLSDLQYLGITHVRDYAPNLNTWLPTGYAINSIKTLASNGISFDFVTDCNSDLSLQLGQVDALAQEFPKIVTSVEGPNEINNFPCNVGGGSNEQNAENFQRSLYSAAKVDTYLSKSPVLYMTGAAPVNLFTQTGLASTANTHPYPYGGVQPFARLEQDFKSYFLNFYGTDSHHITETGYATIPTSQDPDGVDEQAQGELLMNLYFDAALQGNTRTFIYQLLEPYANYATSSDTAYGLFHYTDGSPKMAAVLLHNLQQVLPHDASSGHVPVSASVSGLPATAHTLALTASDGTIALFMWNEVPVWDASSQTLLSPSNVPVEVKMNGSWNVSYFTPTSPTTTSVSPDSNGAYNATLTPYPTALIFHRQ